MDIRNLFHMVSLIWDLDGTLLDSYKVIVDSLFQIYQEQGIELDKHEILCEVIRESVSAFILKMEQKYGVPFEALQDRYYLISRREKENIGLIPHAKETLNFVKENHIKNFVYTHRGVSTESVLKNNDIYDYFDEIVTSLNGFIRKPNPEGIDYLVNKYHLDKEHTFYVGDRTLDIECACNAGIKSIMYIPQDGVAIPHGKETYLIDDLIDIKEIVIKYI